MHVIRLREPWEREVVANTTDVSDMGRPVQESDRLGLVRFRRRFGQPTGLKPDDQIDLVIEGIAAAGHVWLNDVLLGTMVAGGKPARFCLRGRLQAPDQLLMEFAALRSLDGSQVSTTEPNQTFAGYAGEVRLEMRHP